MLARWRLKVSTEVAEPVFLSVVVGNTLAQDILISSSRPKAELELNYTLNLNSTAFR